MAETLREVFKLDMVDNGRLKNDGLVFVDEKSLMGLSHATMDFTQSSFSRDWQARRLAHLWPGPREVSGIATRGNDFVWLGADTPGFSQRAVDGLQDLLEPNGELLPLKTPPGVGTYWAYNVTTVADVLDEQRSIMFLNRNSTWDAQSISRYEFDAGIVPELSIFRIPNARFDIYATNRFIDRVRELGLKGLRARKVWPLPPEVNWREFAKQESKKGSRAKSQGTSPHVSKAAAAPKYTSRPPRGAELESLKIAISQYPAELKWDVSRMTPDDVQKKIFETLEKLRAAKKDKEILKDRAFWFGIAWGESVVKALGWQWAMVEDPSNNAASMAVVSPDRAYAVLPILFIERIITNPDADPTSQLLFNMIKAGKVPKAEPGQLQLLW